MSSGRLSGLATASKAISGAVWADAGNAPSEVAASKSNKKRFMVNLLPMLLCNGFGISETCPSVIARLDRAIQYPKRFGDNRECCGLLDSPLEAGNDMWPTVIAPPPSSWHLASG